MNPHDTIVALSTPPGRGGIGVIRLSGGAARGIAGKILSFPLEGGWRAWGARLAEVLDADGNVVDEAVATFFESPRSYTAEDVVEIACHGAPVVLRLAIDRALQAGARLAEPGEFTLRAFLNGRLDLPRAEAVRDLIEATTLYQARIAAQQAGGSVSRRIAPLKNALIELIALLEAGIDFAEDDVSVASPSEIFERLEPIRCGIRKLAESYAYGSIVREGLALAIVGRPNVGKSSLFNALLESERAIVTPIPGTTRDLVSETASIHGIPVKLYDTAGIRETGETVESLGIERSFQAMADAGLTVVVVDASRPIGDEDRALIEQAREQGRWLLAANKVDLCGVKQGRPELDACVSVSALTGEGLPELRQAIVDSVAPGGAFESQDGFITNLRQEKLLRETGEWLEKAQGAVDQAIPHEMLLLDLYAALRPLDALTGATTADDILNRIFSTFCIGK